jgi:hypothetical protein
VRAGAFHLIACGLAALAPLVPYRSGAEAGGVSTTAPLTWPQSFEGRPLVERALGDRDRRFAQDFPGRVGRFTDGTREIILRFATRATRRLHPASDCLRAVGFTIEPRPARLGPDGNAWGCFAARRANERLTVCEQIRDADGRTWPDPSTWYWPARLGQSRGPWWGTTLVESPTP